MGRRVESLVFLLISTLLLSRHGCRADTETIPGDGSGAPFRLLFVGNSIFFTNGGVNHVVAKLLQQRFPRVAIEASQVAEPNFLLRQHLERAWRPGTRHYDALGINSTAVWDFVIFQEESRQLALGGEDIAKSIEALKGLTWLAHARGARVGVVQTWAWVDGKNKLWPTFEAMQDRINNATAGYMEAERQVEDKVFLAPVGLSYEFVHDISDLADFAHGQDREAPVGERMLALVKNPYASILRVCKSKRSRMEIAGGITDAVSASIVDANEQGMISSSANTAETAKQKVSDIASSEGHFSQTDSSADRSLGRRLLLGSFSGTSNSNRNKDEKDSGQGEYQSKANTHYETDLLKSESNALRRNNSVFSGAWGQDKGHLKYTGRRGSPLNVCQSSNLPAGNSTFKDLYSDGLHPSEEGTYLQGLIIASAITGCRMLGVPYVFGLDLIWAQYLQSLSDAIVFNGTPDQYPPYFWSMGGHSCLLDHIP